MISPYGFDLLIPVLAKLNGLDIETAALVVVAVGDTPMLDEKSGKIVAQLPGGRELLIDWPEDDDDK